MGQVAMAEQRKRVTVVVADDHPLYREGVVRALLASGRIEIVAEASDGRAALAEDRDPEPELPSRERAARPAHPALGGPAGAPQ